MALNPRTALSLCLLLALILQNVVTAATTTARATERPAGPRTEAAPAAAAPAEARPNVSAAAFGELPLSFEENRGQAAAEGVRFLTRGYGYDLALSPDETVLSLCNGERAREGRAAAGGAGACREVRMRLAGARRSPLVEGLEPLPGTANLQRRRPRQVADECSDLRPRPLPQRLCGRGR